MAQDDIKGSKSGDWNAAAKKAQDSEELLSEQASNVAVGDFVSELATAIRYRIRMGQPEGDFIEEPERCFTDGMVFAVEETVASQVKLQLTVSMDASTSMWANNIMRFAGPTFVALDRIIRKAMLDLPQGTIHYAPFIFHGVSFKLPSNFLRQYSGRLEFRRGEDAQYKSERFSGWPAWVSIEDWRRAQELGEIPGDMMHGEYKMLPTKDKLGRVSIRNQYVPTMPLSGVDTRIAPLFQAIKDWEERDGDTGSVRLDIVITDGVFKHHDDMQEATRIQMGRGGKLRTVLLNFLPMNEWSDYPVPEQCQMFAVTTENLDTSIRNLLNEAIAELLG